MKTDYLVIDLDFDAVILRIADPDLRTSDFPDGIAAFKLERADGTVGPLEAWGLDGTSILTTYSIQEVCWRLDLAA